MEFTVPSVRQLIEDAAKKYENETFLMFSKDGQIVKKSYRTVLNNALCVCRWMRHLSTKPMHIAIIGQTSYEYITFLTGILISGNVAIPFSPDISSREAAELLERSDVDMLLFDASFEKKAEEVKAFCKRVKYIENIVDPVFFASILQTYSAESEFSSLSDYEVDTGKCAAIIYTSGTTGVRKGVMLSTKSLVGNIMYDDYCKNIFEVGDVSLSILPMYHIYCFTGDYLKNMKDGLQVVLNGDMRNIISNLIQFEPKVVRVVPMIAQTLLKRVKSIMHRHPELSVEDARAQVFGRSIQWLISGGAYLDPELIAEYEKIGIFLRQGYGMTEAGCRISVPDNGVSDESVGRVINIIEARVENGEIQVNSPTVMLGYYKMPQETAQMFTEDGWLKTGDIGILTDDNELFITGRVKNLIILSNGENVSPEAIEKKFKKYPIVSEVMVYAEKDSIVAEIFPDIDYVCRNVIKDVEQEIQSIIDKMNQSAKPSHVIARFKLRSEPFERTGSGKIKRKSIDI